ncbi:MAG: hypothetical protein WC817_01355 [Patescibacteria group bacterium]|jgi:hypothetical protein
MKNVDPKTVDSQMVPAAQRLIMWGLLAAITGYAFYEWVLVIEVRRPFAISGAPLVGAVVLFGFAAAFGLLSSLSVLEESFNISWRTLLKMWISSVLAVVGWWLAVVGVI